MITAFAKYAEPLIWNEGGGQFILTCRHHDFVDAPPAVKLMRPNPRPSHHPGGDLQSSKFPAIAWLEELLADTPMNTRSILAFMPSHIAGLPAPGSREAAREQTCKARIWAVGKRRSAQLIDFRIYSGITTRDVHFWDRQHYRLPIAHRIVEGIAQAVATRLDDPGGDWTYVH